MELDYLRRLYDGYELFPREEYRGCDLPGQARQILCEMGLPKIEFFLTFYTEKDEPVTLAQFHESFDVEGLADMVVIGETEYLTPLCLNKKGEVVVIDGVIGGDVDCESDIYVVNGSLEGLLECIAAYWECARKISVQEADRARTADELDQARAALTEELREEFRRIDPCALAQEEGWWPFLLEELESGVI